MKEVFLYSNRGGREGANRPGIEKHPNVSCYSLVVRRSKVKKGLKIRNKNIEVFILNTRIQVEKKYIKSA